MLKFLLPTVKHILKTWRGEKKSIIFIQVFTISVSLPWFLKFQLCIMCLEALSFLLTVGNKFLLLLHQRMSYPSFALTPEEYFCCIYNSRWFFFFFFPELKNFVLLPSDWVEKFTPILILSPHMLPFVLL